MVRCSEGRRKHRIFSLFTEVRRLVADAIKIMLESIDSSFNIVVCYSTQYAFSILDSGERFDLMLTNLFMPGIDGICNHACHKTRRAALNLTVLTRSIPPYICRKPCQLE